MSKSIFINAITILFVLFIGVIIFSANTGINLVFFNLIGQLPMGDKMAHMGLVGMLAFLINLSLKKQTFQLFNRQILVGSAIVFCLITIEEFSQIWVASRNFDLVDLACNYIGIFIASWIILKTTD